jgi:glycosyltransferase involved in cell wall biosynthesis
MTLGFLIGQATYMQRRGFEVIAVSSPGEDLDRFSRSERVETYGVEMARRITPWQDVLAVYRIYQHFRHLKPRIVHGHTPKGGLLAMIAGWLARVPVRIYHIHGFPFMTANGARRALLRWTEWISCRLAHRVLCDSRSVRQVAITEHMCPSTKITVLVNGTINGIDAVQRFNPAAWSDKRNDIRHRHSIPLDATVIGLFGRLVRDKGVIELIEAWKVLRDENPALHLLLVGCFESHNVLPADIVSAIHTDPRIHLTGWEQCTPPFYAAIDVVAVPTHREGFSTIVLEAAAMGLPVVATRIPGCVDGIVDGVTGTLIPPGDSGALARALKTYLDDPRLRAAHGAAGRPRVVRDFAQEDIWKALYGEYIGMLKSKDLSIPAIRQPQGGIT